MALVTELCGAGAASIRSKRVARSWPGSARHSPSCSKRSMLLGIGMSSRGTDCGWANQVLASPVKTKKSATPCRTTCSRLIGTLRRLCCIRFTRRRAGRTGRGRGTPSAPSPAYAALGEPDQQRNDAQREDERADQVDRRRQSRRGCGSRARGPAGRARERRGEPLERHDVCRHGPSSRLLLARLTPSARLAGFNRQIRARAPLGPGTVVDRRNRDSLISASASATTPAVTPEPQLERRPAN